MSAYSQMQILGHENALVQVETTAADIKTYSFPVAVEVIAFGAMIGEDFTAHAIDPVVSVDHLDKIGGTRTEKAALTLSGTATLKSGDGDKAGQTDIAASTDLDNGDVVFADRDNFPFVVLPGESIVLEAKTASGSAGGAYKAFVLINVMGERALNTNVWLEID